MNGTPSLYDLPCCSCSFFVEEPWLVIIKGDGILFSSALNIYVIFCTTIRREKRASRSFLHFLHISGYHNGRQNCHATSVRACYYKHLRQELYISAQVSPKPANSTKNCKKSVIKKWSRLANLCIYECNWLIIHAQVWLRDWELPWKFSSERLCRRLQDFSTVGHRYLFEGAGQR